MLFSLERVTIYCSSVFYYSFSLSTEIQHQILPWVRDCFKSGSLRKQLTCHYVDTSPVWNFCAHSSEVISGETSGDVVKCLLFSQASNLGTNARC